MNCREVRELLSAYYDGELAGNMHATLSDHIDACSDCAGELARFERLSAMVGELSCSPPGHLWSEIEKQLDTNERTEQNGTIPAGRLPWSGRPVFRFAAAAAALVLLAAGWFGYGTWLGHERHGDLANDFSHYMTQLQGDPDAARQFLVAKYDGQPLDASKAAERLGYRPAVASGLPPGYTLIASDVLEMPCCTCFGSLCKRDDGSTVAIFEHDTERPDWFRDRPAIHTHCCGQPTRIVEVDADRLAATWPLDKRYLTVIGARNVEEVAQLVSYLKRPGEDL